MKTIYHKHHIIPKHAGGTDDLVNLVKLTIEEHADAHKKLFEKYGRWQDKVAYEGLLGLTTNAGQDAIQYSQNESNRRNLIKRGFDNETIEKVINKEMPYPKKKQSSAENKAYSSQYPASVDGRFIRENRFWYNDGGSEGQYSHINFPKGWVKGRIKMKKIYFWYHNNIIERRCAVGDKPNGWMRGRLSASTNGMNRKS